MGIDHFTAMLLNPLRKIHLIGMLDRHKLCLEAGIIRIAIELLQLFQILWPSISNLTSNQGTQAWIAGQQPAPGGDAIGHVDNFPRIEGIKIMK